MTATRCLRSFSSVSTRACSRRDLAGGFGLGGHAGHGVGHFVDPLVTLLMPRSRQPPIALVIGVVEVRDWRSRNPPRTVRASSFLPTSQEGWLRYRDDARSGLVQPRPYCSRFRTAAFQLRPLITPPPRKRHMATMRDTPWSRMISAFHMPSTCSAPGWRGSSASALRRVRAHVHRKMHALRHARRKRHPADLRAPAGNSSSSALHEFPACTARCGARAAEQ